MLTVYFCMLSRWEKIHCILTECSAEECYILYLVLVYHISYIVLKEWHSNFIKCNSFNNKKKPWHVLIKAFDKF